VVSTRRLLSWTVSLLLAAGLLYLSLRGVDWHEVWRTLAGARWPFLAISGGIASTSLLLRALRWRILLNAEGRLGVGTVFWCNMAGYLGNNFLPARAGEVVRTVLIHRQGSLTKTYVLTTALAERLADAIALVLWSAIILLGGVNPKPRWITGVSGTMAVIAAAGAAAIIVLPHTSGLIEPVLLRLPLGRFRKPLMTLAGQVLLGLRAFHQWGRFLGFALLTAAIWTMDACNAMALGSSLGLHIRFAVAMLLITGLGLGSALPATPGYVGIYQFVAVTVLAPFGIDRDRALAFILIVQAMGYALVLLYGLAGLFMLKRRASLPDGVLFAEGRQEPNP
jgi:glycosyltransferase 2 family protein